MKNIGKYKYTIDGRERSRVININKIIIINYNSCKRNFKNQNKKSFYYNKL